jgi:hypothetical protein
MELIGFLGFKKRGLIFFRKIVWLVERSRWLGCRFRFLVRFWVWLGGRIVVELSSLQANSSDSLDFWIMFESQDLIETPKIIQISGENSPTRPALQILNLDFIDIFSISQTDGCRWKVAVNITLFALNWELVFFPKEPKTTIECCNKKRQKSNFEGKKFGQKIKLSAHSGGARHENSIYTVAGSWRDIEKKFQFYFLIISGQLAEAN